MHLNIYYAFLKIEMVNFSILFQKAHIKYIYYAHLNKLPPVPHCWFLKL